jgi:hypothetical protein
LVDEKIHSDLLCIEKLREDCCKCGGKKLSWGKVTICDDGVWEEKVYSGWWGFMLV